MVINSTNHLILKQPIKKQRITCLSCVFLTKKKTPFFGNNLLNSSKRVKFTPKKVQINNFLDYLEKEKETKLEKTLVFLSVYYNITMR
jgi:hypothetical protein